MVQSPIHRMANKLQCPPIINEAIGRISGGYVWGGFDWGPSGGGAGNLVGIP